MFGLSLDTIIKKDLLHILDNYTDFVSTKLLVDHIEYANHYIVKKSLIELYDEIRTNYAPEDLSLKISKNRGVKLYSKDGNLYDLINSFISKDIAYQILLTVIVQRCVPSKVLCEELFISESSLRRRIKEINSELANYHLRITFSKHIRLIGPEHMIRVIHFILLFYVYRQLENLPNMEDQIIYRQMAAQVTHYLYLPATSHQQEVLAFFLLANDHAIKGKNALTYSKEELTFFSEFTLPEFPKFLSGWNFLDWQFLVLSLSISDWPGLTLSLDLRKVIVFSKTGVVDLWMTLLEHTFSPIQLDSREQVKEKAYKQLMVSSFFPLDDTLFNMFHANDYMNMTSLYPFYMQRFNTFWQKFIATYPEYDSNFSRQTNLLLVISLFPITVYSPEIKIYNYSHMTTTLNHFIEQQVSNYFCSRYNIIFVDHINDADIIIGTHAPSKQTLHTHSEKVIIESVLSKADFDRIERAIDQSLSVNI